MIFVMVAGLTLTGCEGLRIDRLIKGTRQDWGTLGGSATRANQSVSVLRPPLKEAWQYNAGGGILATPLVRDDIMLVCTLKGELHAVNMQNGKRIGFITLDGAVTGTPVWNGVVAYIPISNEDETIESVDLQNGSRDWVAKLGSSESSPLAHEKYLYVTSLNGRLYCLNISDGSEVWNFKTGTDDARRPIRSSPATDGATIAFGCDDGCLYGVACSDGSRKWKFQTGQSIFASPIIVDGRVVVGSLDCKVYCLELSTGALVWSFDAKSRVFGNASTNGKLVFVGAADGTCYALDVANGSVVWKFDAKSVINSAPLVVNDVLYVGSLDKNVYALDIQTGRQIWNFVADGRVKVSPVLWGGTLLIASEDSYVTALR
jgi:outer membrane protein assembly factor BamB